jgi:hypothetical protein
MVTFDGGAKRSDEKPLYRNIPYTALNRTAKAFSDGAPKYDESLTQSNYEKGDEKFAFACLDHVVEHIYKYIAIRRGQYENLSGDDLMEDHLGHASAGLAMIMRLEELGVVPMHGVERPETEEVMGGDTLLTNAEIEELVNPPEEEEVSQQTSAQTWFQQIFGK